jgi:hypothetical protein
VSNDFSSICRTKKPQKIKNKQPKNINKHQKRNTQEQQKTRTFKAGGAMQNLEDMKSFKSSVTNLLLLADYLEDISEKIFSF